MHVETSVGWRIRPSQVVPEEVVTVHLGFEAGDVTVAEVFTELIDLFQF